MVPLEPTVVTVGQNPLPQQERRNRRATGLRLHDGKYFRDDLVDAHPGGIDQHGIVGRLERRDRARCIAAVTRLNFALKAAQV